MVINNNVILSWIQNITKSEGSCTITLPITYTKIPVGSKTANEYSSSANNRAIRSTTCKITTTSIQYWTSASTRHMFVVMGY